MKKNKSSSTIKLLVFSLLSVVALWSYTPSSSISSIANAISTGEANNNVVLGTLSSGEAYKKYEDGTAEYRSIPELNQYLYTDVSAADWWFVFTTPNGSTANISLDFTGVEALTAPGQTADIGIFIDYNGDTIDGTVNGIPHSAPTVDTNFDFTLSDGTTGVLTYSPSASQFTISIN